MRRAESSSVAMSASLNWRGWKAASRVPNWRRSRMYPRAGRERGGIRAAARLGQAVAGEMLHAHQLGQEACALRIIAETVDHPRRHVVDREVGGGRDAGGSQLLKDDRRVEPRQAATAE